MYCRWISNYPINRFNPTTFLCLFQARTLISNVIYHGLFMFSELREDCSFYWYWYNCWLSLFKLSSPNYINSKLLSSLSICVTNDRGYVSICRNHNLVLSSFMIYHQVCKKSNMTGTTYGAGAAYPSGASEFTPGFLLVLVGFVLFALSNYMSSRFWFHVVMYATISA